MHIPPVPPDTHTHTHTNKQTNNIAIYKLFASKILKQRLYQNKSDVVCVYQAAKYVASYMFRKKL